MAGHMMTCGWKQSIENGNKLAKQTRPGEDIRFVWGDANDLSAIKNEDGSELIPQNSAQEVLMENVLLSAGVTNVAMHKMLVQAYRVLQNGGSLMIGEDFSRVHQSPSKPSDLAPYESSYLGLAAALDAVGFTVRGIDPNRPRWVVARKTPPEQEQPQPSIGQKTKKGWLSRINRSQPKS